MQKFLETKKKRCNPAQFSRFQELIDGLRVYFEKALGKILLYRQERAQYDHVTKASPGKDASQIYGCEHLLRLFVRLPALLAETALSQQEVSQIQVKLAEFLRFLQKNQAEFFLAEYEPWEVVQASWGPMA
ncbi:unnamed protein product [Phaeothamnion confervicola]